MRIRMTVSYNGAAFMGLQIQASTPNTVIGTMTAALARLGIDTKLHASGRTDRGVHASGQVIHCDVERPINDFEGFRRYFNRHLPTSIRVRHVAETADDFHARYGAKRRVYRYLIKEGEPNPFEADFVTFVDTLDFDRVAEAIRRFEGEHDFEMFKKNGSDVNHYVRTVYKAFAYRRKGMTVLYFEANGYLRSQVRLMVGMLLGISEGRYSLDDLDEQLACRKRTCIRPAPGAGLYLARIRY